MGRLILLGTGDPLNGERAQSCPAVPLAGDETMLVDASSGTVLLRQLEAAGIALESIRHLFVTHRHFDHVSGLAPLLIALAALPDAALTVYATPATLGPLRELLALTIPGVETGSANACAGASSPQANPSRQPTPRLHPSRWTTVWSAWASASTGTARR